MTQIREIENELIADVFAATDSDCTNGLSVEECMDCLESCGIRATGKQMSGGPADAADAAGTGTMWNALHGWTTSNLHVFFFF
eukprot:g6258.t1